MLTGELTSINQYFVDAKMCGELGHERLAEKFREESIGEMKDADVLIERRRGRRRVVLRAFVRSGGSGWWSVFGVAGVVGWDEGSFAGAGDEGPAVVGFEVVVVGAERVELIEPCVFGAGPFGIVIVFEVLGAGAAQHRAARCYPPQRGLLGDGGSPTQMGDVGDVDALGDHEFQDRVAQQVAGDPDRDRADPFDLADLVLFDPPPPQGGEIDPDDPLISWRVAVSSAGP